MYASEEEARIDVSRILGSIGERLEHFCGRARFWNRGTRHGSRSGKSDTSRNVVVLHETTTKRAIPDPFKFFSVWFAQKKTSSNEKKQATSFGGACSSCFHLADSLGNLRRPVGALHFLCDANNTPNRSSRVLNLPTNEIDDFGRNMKAQITI